MNITRDAALCMYFYEEHTDENVEKCKERIGKWGDVEICYINFPNEPVVVLKRRVLGDPYTYKKYLESSQPVEEVVKRKRIEFVQSHAQVKLFLNEAFCAEDPNNSSAYKIKSMTTKEIFEITQQYTSLFNEKTAQAFSKWCSNNSISFLKANTERNTKSRKRQLFTLEDIYYADLLENICWRLPRYKASLVNLKKSNYEIIGYVRKSPSNIDSETRRKLLQKMVENMFDRSLVDKVFVSPSSLASVPFNQRDSNQTGQMIKKLKNVTGNTSDMLEYLQSINHDICLASIDFAGISSRPHLIKDLLEKFPVIKKIAIETFISNNEIFLLDSQRMLSDNQLLEKFDCRKKLIQRSK